MRFGAAVLLAGALAITLGACEARLNKTDLEGNPVHGFLPNPQTVTQTTNWDQTQNMALRVRNYDIDPGGLRLQQGLPYRLIIENVGNYVCYFASEGLLKTAAVKKLVGPTGEKTFPYYEEIAVLPGETKELWFVPVAVGEFDAECASTSHSLLGDVVRVSVLANPAFARPAATQPGALIASYGGTTIAAAVVGAPRPDRNSLYQVEAARIASASTQQLEKIKISLRDLILLIRQREAQIQAGE